MRARCLLEGCKNKAALFGLSALLSSLIDPTHCVCTVLFQRTLFLQLTTPTTTLSTTPTTTPTTVAVAECEDPKPVLVFNTPNKTSWRCETRKSFVTETAHLIQTVSVNAGMAVKTKEMAKQNGNSYMGNAAFAAGVYGGKISVNAVLPQFASISTSTLTTKALAPGRIAAVLLSDAVFVDEPVVKATVQVRDVDQYSVATTTARVMLRVQAPQGTTLADQTSGVVSCAKSSDGMCDVEVRLDEAYFGADAEALVFYSLEVDGKMQEFQFEPKITIARAPDQITSSDGNSVFATLPFRPLYAGESFAVEVRSNFNRYLETAKVVVTTGSALQVTKIQMAQKNGKAVFQVSKIADGETIKSIIIGGKRSDSPPGGTQSGPTNELLFTLTIKGKTSAGVANDNKRIEIVLNKEGIRDVQLNQLTIDSPSIIRSRDGLRSTRGEVYFVDRAELRGLLPYTKSAAELFNTAAFTGKATNTPITVMAIARDKSRKDVTSQATCSTQAADVMSLDACAVSVSGSESKGAKEAIVKVEFNALEGSVPFRVHYPENVKVTPELTTLRAISGWYKNQEKIFRYQSTKVKVVADFSDGSNDGPHFQGYDVSMFARLQTSPTRVVYVDGSSVIGKSPGEGRVSVKGFENNDATIVIKSDTIGVAGLDVVLISRLGSLSLTPTGPQFARDTKVTIKMSPPVVNKLKYRGDSLRLAVSVVLQDGSRIPLNSDMGLSMVSTNTKAAVVSSTLQKVTVPKDPIHHDGELVNVSWNPSSKYNSEPLISIGVVIAVSPPPAKSIKVTQKVPDFIVPVGDTAAVPGAGLPFKTSFQLKIALEFPDKDVDVTGDERASYSVSDETLFSVSQQGMVTANNKGAIGIGRVTVSFRGQNATKVIPVTIEKFKELTVHAVPEPSYPTSPDVRVTRISKIECTNQYQQALFVVGMVLTNDYAHRITVVKSYSFVTNPESTVIVIDDSGVVTASGAASGIKIHAKFGEGSGAAVTSDTPVELTVSGTEVTVKRVDLLQMVAAANGARVTTVLGAKGSTASQVMHGITLSDDRQYPRVMNLDGTSMLPGLMSFASKQPNMVSVETATGKATLENNSYTDVQIDAYVCGPGAKRLASGSSFQIPSNLQPTQIGDVDLGNPTGLPLQPCRVGDIVDVDARVNTGNKFLTGFDMRIRFNPNELALIGNAAKIKVPTSDGQTVFASKIKAVDATTHDITAAATISASKVTSKNRPNGYTIFTMKFKCLKMGLSSVSGRVFGLVEKGTLLSIGPATQASPATFRAGAVKLSIIKGTRLNRHARLVLPEHALPDTLQRTEQIMLPVTLQRTEQIMLLEQETAPNRARRAGDICDDYTYRLCQTNPGVDVPFVISDANLVLEYLAWREVTNRETSPTGSAWWQLKPSLDCCKISYDDEKSGMKLDVDGSGAVEPMDSTLVVNIVGLTRNVVQLTNYGVSEDTCDFRIDALMFENTGVPAKSDSRLFMDLATSKDVPSFSQALASSTQMITLDKGSAKLYGALMEAKRNLNEMSMKYSLSIPLKGTAQPNITVGVSLLQVTTIINQNEKNWQFYESITNQSCAAACNYERGLAYNFNWLSGPKEAVGKAAFKKISEYHPYRQIQVEPLKACRGPYNFTRGIVPLIQTVSVNAGMAVKTKEMAKQNDNSYMGNAAFAAGVYGGEISVNAVLPQFASIRTTTLTTKALAPGRIAAVLLSDAVFVDEPVVKATVQVRDVDQYSVATTTARVMLRVQAPQGTTLADQTSGVVSCAKSSDGMCDVEVRLDEAYFGADAEALVFYSLEVDGKMQEFQFEPKITIARAPDQITTEAPNPTAENTITTTLPFRPLYAGQEFSIEIRSRFRRFLQTATIDIDTKGGVDITKVKTVQLPNSKTNVFGNILVWNDLTSRATVVFAGSRKDSKPTGVQPQPTNELLCTVTFTAPQSVVGLAEPSYIDVKIRPDGVRDVGNIPVAVNTARVIRSRDGLRSMRGEIHFIDRTELRGLLPYTKSAAELFNTAAFTGKATNTPITVMAIARDKSRKDVTSQATCSTQAADVMSLDACAVSVSGSESKGAKEAIVKVAFNALEGSVPFRVHYPENVKVTPELTTLRAIRGWYSDEACTSLNYQSTKVKVVADFSDGSNDGPHFQGYDVSTFARVQLNDTSLASVDGAKVVGKSPGAVRVSVSGFGAMSQITLGALDDAVDIAGLDIAPISRLAPISLTSNGPQFARDTKVSVTTSVIVDELKYEGDSVRLAVSAVMYDGYRLHLTNNDELSFLSLNERAAVVSSTLQKVTVPKDPIHHDGELVVVEWTPQSSCNDFEPIVLKDRLVIAVSPPPAKSIKVTQKVPDFIVPVGDTAAVPGAGLPFKTSFQLKIALEFPDKDVDVTGDERASYSVSDETLFSVSQQGMVTANNKGAIGIGRVTVSFRGQNATKVIPVTIEKFKELTVHAVPEPSYPTSPDVRVTRISKIECTNQYQQALFVVGMVLTNDYAHRITVVKSYSFVTNPESTVIVIDDSGVVTASGAASGIKIHAKFGEGSGAAVTSDTPVELTVSGTEVTVKRVDLLQMVAAANGARVTTVLGAKGSTASQVMHGITLSDDRQYPRVMNLDGTSMLPGLMSFASKQPNMVSVETATGKATLENNSYTDVQIDAYVCGPGAKRLASGSSFQIPSNLQPTQIGDVDLGNPTGLPLQPCRVGDIVDVDARVNTGTRTLAGLGLTVYFDSEYVSMVGGTVKSTIADDLGSADMKSSVDTNNFTPGDTTRGIVVYATIEDSRLQGTHSLFSFQLKCLKPGLTSLSGQIIELVGRDDRSKMIGPTTASNPTQFESGDIKLQISGSGGRIRRAPRQIVRQPRRSNVLRAGGKSSGIVTARRQSRNSAADCHSSTANVQPFYCLVDGDGDGRLSTEDSLMILEYILYSEPSRRTGKGWQKASERFDIEGISFDAARFPRKLDADQNKKIEALDSSFLLQVLAKVFYLNKLTHIQSNACTLDVV